LIYTRLINGVIGGVGMALIGGFLDGPRYALIMGCAGFVGGLFMSRPQKRPETTPAAAVEPARPEADK